MTCTPAEKVTETLSDNDTDRFITFMTILPDGLCSLHKHFEHKYESCVNVGVVEMQENAIRVITCIRSALASKKYFQFDKIEKVCHVMGVTYNILHDLPQWEYNNHARVAEVIGSIYADMEPNVAQGTFSSCICRVLRLPELDLSLTVHTHQMKKFLSIH